MANENIPKIMVKRFNESMIAKDDVILARHLSALQIVMQYFKKNVLIHYLHGEMDGNSSPDILVNMWSALPNSELIFPDLDTAFGFKYCNDAVFAPNENAVTFGDDIPLIQYLPEKNRIDFLYDICENKSEDEVKLMRYLVFGLMDKIAGSREKLLAQAEEFKTYLFSLKRKAVIQNLTENEKQNNKRRQERLRNNERNLQDYRNKVKSLVISIEADKQLFKAGESILAGIELKLDQEFDIIRANKKVIGLDVDTSGMLNIFTDTLYSNVMCKDGVVRRYMFGKYRININIGDGHVHFYNMNIENTRCALWSQNDPHPHVGGDSNEGCLGNCAPLIADCIDTYQWGALADILINYLESVNTNDSAGRKYSRWTEVDKDNNPITGKAKYFNEDDSDAKKYTEPVLKDGIYKTENIAELTMPDLEIPQMEQDWDEDEDTEENDDDGYDE